MATSEATVGQVPDQYGQVHPVETPELIARKRAEFENELKKLPTDRLTGVKQAEVECPHLLTDEFKLMFLRAEVFNADLAAERYAKYWDARIAICGPEKAFLPLTLDGALKDDWTALTLGFIQLIPNAKDVQGRSILFLNPAKQGDKSTYSLESLNRAVWYSIHAALENEETQKRGLIFVERLQDLKWSHFDRKWLKSVVSNIQGVVPGRVSAVHICQPPFFIKIVLAFLNLFLKERVKKRFRFHFGNEQQVVDQLLQCGLEKESLPTDVGGNVVLDPEGWLNDRKKEGK